MVDFQKLLYVTHFSPLKPIFFSILLSHSLTPFTRHIFPPLPVDKGCDKRRDLGKDLGGGNGGIIDTIELKLTLVYH